MKDRTAFYRLWGIHNFTDTLWCISLSIFAGFGQTVALPGDLFVDNSIRLSSTGVDQYIFLYQDLTNLIKCLIVSLV